MSRGAGGVGDPDRIGESPDAALGKCCRARRRRYRNGGRGLRHVAVAERRCCRQPRGWSWSGSSRCCFRARRITALAVRSSRSARSFVASKTSGGSLRFTMTLLDTDYSFGPVSRSVAMKAMPRSLLLTSSQFLSISFPKLFPEHTFRGAQGLLDSGHPSDALSARAGFASGLSCPLPGPQQLALGRRILLRGDRTAV